MATKAVITDKLTKVYGGKIKAVSEVSIQVDPGEAFGFLGPNGAGKTTTVGMLTAGLRPTSGSAIVDGLDVMRQPELVKKRIGVIFQESTADGDLTGRENLEVAAGCFQVGRAEARTRSESLIERMQLSEAADRLAKTYSGGMRRRLELAVGLINQPKILFLDEPTLGLDPQGRAGFWDFVQKLRKDTGLTVFVTTHYLDEADTMCDRIAIIDHGQIVATGSPGELKDRLGGDIMSLRTAAGAPDLTEVIRRLPGVSSVTRQDDTYRVKCSNGETVVPLAVEAGTKAGAGVIGVSVKRPSLDEVFLEFTGREFREDAEGLTATDRAVMLNRIRGQMRR